MSARSRSLLRQVVPPVLAGLLILALTHSLDPRTAPDAPTGTNSVGAP